MQYAEYARSVLFPEHLVATFHGGSQRRRGQPGVPKRGGLPVDNAPPPIESLKQVNLNAAGIDIASAVHFVAVPKDRDSTNSVRSFGAFTADLEAIADG